MVQANPVVDINTELEELPGLIAYQEQAVEDCILEIDEAKNKKNEALSKVILDNTNMSYMQQKALQKKVLAEEDTKILILKKKLAKEKVEFNRLKNRFQSIRKLASLRIEEMKHGMEGGVIR